MNGAPVVVVGDTFLDRDLVGHVDRLSPDAPVPVLDRVDEHSRPGGAGLAALMLARDAQPVVLVTALGTDTASDELRASLAAAGVEVVDLGRRGDTVEKVRIGTESQRFIRVDRGTPGAPVGSLGRTGASVVDSAAAVLVADYGDGVAGERSVRRALRRRPQRTPLVWDPHPRGAEPVAGASVATPNAFEAGIPPDARLADVARAAEKCRAAWRAHNVAVSLGARGVLLSSGAGTPLAVPAPPATGDPCGAGDRFASAVARLLAGGALPSEAVVAGVQIASAFVAAGGVTSMHGAPIRDGTDDDAFARARAVAAAGGTVVAAGGCFDLLHAGHVAMLDAARALGDCLVVCLNSDNSVRRVKGPDRPLQPEADRAALLSALGCVDGVVIFDDNTPIPVLRRLRPHVFAKGADYTTDALPETQWLASWGGQTVVLPYLEGRSTTRLVQEASRRGEP